MSKDIFLTYVNNPLKNNPENLHKIFQAIQQNVETDLTKIEEGIVIICELSKYSDYETIHSLAVEKDLIGGGIWGVSNTWFHAITGGRDSYYAQKEIYKNDPEFLKLIEQEEKSKVFDCVYREMNKNLLGEDLCEESFNLKCYECFQLDFIQTIQEITQGKEYLEIKDFEDKLYASSIIGMHQIIPEIQKQDKKAAFKGILKGYKSYTLMSYVDYFDSIYGNSYHTFNEYLSGIVCFSLTEFLIRNDRRKIKKCPYCDKFFIAKDIKRKRCYKNDCRKEYEKIKKRKQREDEPEFYS